MTISNNSQKTVLLEKLTSLNGLNKALGLLKFEPPILFRTRWGIHTFFLKQPIDVLILDDQYKVVKVFQKLKPFRVAFWNPRYDIVVELPPGTVQKSRTKLGDQLKIEE